MKTSIFVAMLVAGLYPAAARAPDRGQQGEIVVSGRHAGEPAACISMNRIRGGKMFGEGAILFTTRNRDLFYINRPQKGCPELNSSRALRTDTLSTHLCRGDVVTVFKPRTHTEYGVCRLGDFVPYRRR
jgi:hypothetical protein